jgi:hypothetical protein
VVEGREQHEAARAGHRLDAGPDRRGVAARGGRLDRVRLEPAELSLEVGPDPVEGLGAGPADVVDGEL